ncbi:glycosyltransferase family 10 [Flavicella sp.]|uniref:glycosyltransferase family 10 domain-containing protein n=1 Tax=Flavicella sp. TaxID=2957742 RepID=UPI00301A014B
MKTIYLDFLGFHPDLQIENSSIVKLLGKNYNVKISKDSQYVFIGSFNPYSYIRQTRDKISIFYPGEAIFPDFNYFDYAIGFDEFNYDDRYFRFLPLANTKKRGNTAKTINNPFNREFCNFIYANPDAHQNRDKFFHLLNKYKKVDSLGSHLKNTDLEIEPRGGNWYQGSIDTKSNYKFSLAFENALYKGYTTEKIISSFQAKSIPIYWGNPNINKEIDPSGFINCHDYTSFEEVIERIKEIDNDKNQYLKMLKSSKSIFFENNFHELQNQNLISFLENIFDKEFHLAKRKPVGYWTSRHLDSLQMKPKNKSIFRNLFKKKMK